MTYFIETDRTVTPWRYHVVAELGAEPISTHETQRQAQAAVARYIKADKRRSKGSAQS